MASAAEEAVYKRHSYNPMDQNLQVSAPVFHQLVVFPLLVPFFGIRRSLKCVRPTIQNTPRHQDHNCSVYCRPLYFLKGTFAKPLKTDDDYDCEDRLVGRSESGSLSTVRLRERITSAQSVWGIL